MEKKNTMLLTVIAVATLLVAVVGATFAYFTASGANSVRTDKIKVTTQNSDTIIIEGGNESLAISANMTNFAIQNGETQAQTATPAVKFTTASSTAKVCYKLSVNFGTHQFSQVTNKPQLVITATKNDDAMLTSELTLTGSDVVGSLTQGEDVTLSDGEYYFPNTAGKLIQKYDMGTCMHTLTGSTSVTDNWKVGAHFVFYTAENQNVNAGKTQDITTKVQVVDCKNGQDITAPQK